MQLRYPHTNRRSRGFSLVEVMVALLVISVGLLGIAKMQALALSNTSGARLRALAAIEGAGLAATLQADRNYWGNITTVRNITVSDTTISSPNDATLGNTISCAYGATGSAAPCTANQMAAYDLQQWTISLQQVMGTNGHDSASIQCTALTATTPVACMITINWAESEVSANSAEASGSSAALTNASYTLFIDP